MNNFTRTSNGLWYLGQAAILMVLIISGLAMIGWVFDLLIIAQLSPNFIPKELRETRDFAEQVIETANVIAIGLNLQGQIPIYNSAAATITGYSCAELEGKNWFELIVPRDRYPQVWEAFGQLIRNEPTYTFENPGSVPKVMMNYNSE